MRGEAQRQDDTHRDRKKYGRKKRYAKEAGVLAHAYQKPALPGKLAAKALRESLDSPGTQIGAQIGEKHYAGESPRILAIVPGIPISVVITVKVSSANFTVELRKMKMSERMCSSIFFGGYDINLTYGIKPANVRRFSTNAAF